MSANVKTAPESDSRGDRGPAGTPGIAAQVDSAKELIARSRLAIPGKYRFDWQGIPVGLSLTQDNTGSDEVRASLSCCLGLLPFTVEDRDRRANAIDMALGVNIRSWDRIRFTPDGGLALHSDSLIPAPADSNALIGILTAWLICLDRDLMPLRMLLKQQGARQAA